MTSPAKTNTNNIDVSELLADLKKGFVADIPVRLDDMESIILSMERGVAFIDNYEGLYRHAHSLKGSAGSYGLHIITSICHAMEDALNEVGRDNNRFNEYGADYWLKYIDLIRLVLAEINKGRDNFVTYEDALKKLQSVQPGGEQYHLHCLVVTASSLYENILANEFGNGTIKFSYCNDGYKALGRLLTESFDLLISDYEVPLLNGQALFGSLRLSDSKNRQIKTMLLTSKTDGKYTRSTDPDYVIHKDKDFSQNLSMTIRAITKQSKSG